MKTLVAGWFSFDRGGATAGDLLACELACEWLDNAGCSYDVALAPPFGDGVNWQLVDPKSYSQFLFVCGPFRRNMGEKEFLKHFSGSRLIGLNVSMPIPLNEWNPFDLLLERDSSRNTRPDMTFLSRQAKVPVVGVCLVEPDIGVAWDGHRYSGGMDAVANEAIQRLVESREISVVLIDTRLDANITGLRTPTEVETLIVRMDMVITTRLHGTVFALKNDVPAIVIETDPRGAKLRRQMEKIGWPVVFIADALNDGSLQQAFDYCLTKGARIKAKECCESAIEALQELRHKFIIEMRCPSRVTNVDLIDTRIATTDSWTPKVHYINRTRFIRFLERVSDEKMLRALQTARVAAFSFEDATANNALLEAMAPGLPIVATDAGGMREYVGQDAGILCPRKDPSALADGILTLLDDAVTREKMANASRSKALLLDYRMVADRMREIYTRVLMRGS